MVRKQVWAPAILTIALSACTPAAPPEATDALTIELIPPVNGADLSAFESVRTLGAQTPDEVREYLELVGDTTAVAALAQGPKPWEYTDHAYGYIPINNASDTVPIVHAGAIAPDASLRNSQVRVTLDRLRVLDYPGSSEHRILVEFYGQNQVHSQGQTQTEHIRFSQYYRAIEGGGAGVIGYPIFNGLNVGSNGVAFRVLTVNVENSNTRNFLNFLDSDVAKQGLGFVAGLNPVAPMLSGFVVGVTKMVASSKHNVAVQSAELGLDFTPGGTGARLAQGSYVLVQVPTMATIDWTQWVYLRNEGVIRSRIAPHGDIPYNYIVFRVTRYAP